MQAVIAGDGFFISFLSQSLPDSPPLEFSSNNPEHDIQSEVCVLLCWEALLPCCPLSLRAISSHTRMSTWTTISIKAHSSLDGFKYVHASQVSPNKLALSTACAFMASVISIAQRVETSVVDRATLLSCVLRVTVIPAIGQSKPLSSFSHAV